ncbi:hypothetical protein SK128_008477 [Halocaridina rubra]|uniref:MYND-type domain-containing protein n=1 Tax=Halocaridina rubra TaxID=373956 RepID=A0AAN9A0V0_HALRR
MEDPAYLSAVRRFFPGLCALCYKHPTGGTHLKHCSQCYLVSYCSKECQKKDWKIHKPFCVVNAAQGRNSVFSKAKTEVKDKEEWNAFRTSLQVAASINLCRNLEVFERDILWYPRLCEVCRESDISKLTACDTCNSVFYCSETHVSENSDDHRKWCHKFLLCVHIDRFEKMNGMSNLPFPIKIYNTYSVLPESMSKLLNSELESHSHKNSNHTMFMIMISDRLTDPITLLYALQHYYFGNSKLKFNEMNQLTIHVVGAESRELLDMIRWEYILHRLPALSKLHVSFIGPKIFSDLDGNGGPEPDYLFDDGMEMRCDDCRKQEKVCVYDMCRMLYEDYLNQDYCTKADAIIVFNCGFHEYEGSDDNTWPKSLSCMISDTSIPLIYTSYTKTEANKDLEALQKIGSISVTLLTQENPFKSLKPIRDSSRNDDRPLFYINQYITGINGQRRETTVD